MLRPRGDSTCRALATRCTSGSCTNSCELCNSTSIKCSKTRAARQYIFASRENILRAVRCRRARRDDNTQRRNEKRCAALAHVRSIERDRRAVAESSAWLRGAALDAEAPVPLGPQSTKISACVHPPRAPQRVARLRATREATRSRLRAARRGECESDRSHTIRPVDEQAPHRAHDPAPSNLPGRLRPAQRFVQAQPATAKQTCPKEPIAPRRHPTDAGQRQKCEHDPGPASTIRSRHCSTQRQIVAGAAPYITSLPMSVTSAARGAGACSASAGHRPQARIPGKVRPKMRLSSP